MLNWIAINYGQHWGPLRLLESHFFLAACGFFAGSLLLEKIFQLDGIGLLGFNSVLSRDYNVIMCLLFFSSIVMIIGNLISDMAYVLVDPRIDFK